MSARRKFATKTPFVKTPLEALPVLVRKDFKVMAARAASTQMNAKYFLTRYFAPYLIMIALLLALSRQIFPASLYNVELCPESYLQVNIVGRMGGKKNHQPNFISWKVKYLCLCDKIKLCPIEDCSPGCHFDPISASSPNATYPLHAL